MSSDNKNEEQKEFRVEQICCVGQCQHSGCGKAASLARVSGRKGLAAFTASASKAVQVCKECYGLHYRGCPIETKNKKPVLLYQEGEQRVV